MAGPFRSRASGDYVGRTDDGRRRGIGPHRLLDRCAHNGVEHLPTFVDCDLFLGLAPQFFTVPTVYRNSVTMSGVILPSRLFHRVACESSPEGPLDARFASDSMLLCKGRWM